jgi:transposase
MGNRSIQDSAKTIALRLLARGRDTRKEIAGICDFSERTLSRVVQRHRATGSVAKAAVLGAGRPRLLDNKDAAYLIRLAKHRPSMFLDEYQHFLDTHRHLPVSIATIHRTFERAGLKVKRVQKMASERDPIQEGIFLHRISQYPAHYLVPLDETSKDDRTYARLWGRSPVGERVEEYSPFVRKRRFTGIAAMGLDKGIIAARVIEGSSDRDTFMDFLRNDLVSVILFLGSLFIYLTATCNEPIPRPTKRASPRQRENPSLTRNTRTCGIIRQVLNIESQVSS